MSAMPLRSREKTLKRWERSSGCVNTFLQLLDEYEVSNGLLIAATNLTKFLDEAVWRRFDDAIEVPQTHRGRN